MKRKFYFGAVGDLICEKSGHFKASVALILQYVNITAIYNDHTLEFLPLNCIYVYCDDFEIVQFNNRSKSQQQHRKREAFMLSNRCLMLVQSSDIT